MTLPKYHATDHAVRPHPHGEYYRVADVDPVLAQLAQERDKCKLIAMRCDQGIQDKIGEVLQLQQQLAAAKKETQP